MLGARSCQQTKLLRGRAALENCAKHLPVMCCQQGNEPDWYTGQRVWVAAWADGDVCLSRRSRYSILHQNSTCRSGESLVESLSCESLTWQPAKLRLSFGSAGARLRDGTKIGSWSWTYEMPMMHGSSRVPSVCRSRKWYPTELKPIPMVSCRVQSVVQERRML